MARGTQGCVVGTVATLLPDDGGIVARFSASTERPDWI